MSFSDIFYIFNIFHFLKFLHFLISLTFEHFGTFWNLLEKNIRWMKSEKIQNGMLKSMFSYTPIMMIWSNCFLHIDTLDCYGFSTFICLIVSPLVHLWYVVNNCKDISPATGFVSLRAFSLLSYPIYLFYLHSVSLSVFFFTELTLRWNTNL